MVALRKESVDRKKDGDKPFQTLTGSLSARRAWIEKCLKMRSQPITLVALRKESVDRKKVSPLRETVPGVALRKESVDRKLIELLMVSSLLRRSPQGERG